jgi:hypothetical protein
MKPFIVLLIIAFNFTLCYSGTNRFTDNKYVTVEVVVKEKNIKPGSSSDLHISLKPVSGIHINLKPAIELKLDSASVVSIIDKPSIPKGKEYLDTSTPVTQRLSIPNNLKPGEISVKGTLTYYYCSDKDGWCSKFKQPFTVTLNVSR